MTAECPKDWYTEEQMREWLKRDGYPFNRDLPRFLAKHFQLALEKGWQLRDSKYRTLVAEVEKLREMARAAVVCDDAIRMCANDPEKMASFCTVEGDDLDALYADWMTKARNALAKQGE